MRVRVRSDLGMVRVRSDLDMVRVRSDLDMVRVRSDLGRVNHMHGAQHDAHQAPSHGAREGGGYMVI